MTSINSFGTTAVHPKQTVLTPIAASADSKLHKMSFEQVEDSHDKNNLVYENEKDEPELHLRTYVAIAAMCVSAFAVLFSIQGPAAVLTQISADLHNTVATTWISSAMTVPQAVLAPVISSAADTFQVRKWLIVGLQTVGIVGSAIAPGSTDIYRVIAAQTLLGFALISVPLTNCIPSEVLPRKWRPMAQAIYNFAGASGAVTSPLLIGALTKRNPHTGWRTYYWVEMAIWALATICIVIGYRPPTRHTKYDHLSLPQKIARLDLIGSALLTVGLTLFLVGVGLGGGLYAWTNAKVLVPLICGLTGMLCFCVYEWKGTTTGILHHELFRGGVGHGRTFAILLVLMFVEGILMFAFVVFYPILTTAVFETDPFLIVARGMPFWIAALLSTVVWGYVSTKLKTIRSTMFAGFAFFTAGIIGIATTQPNTSTALIVFSGVTGLGFGAPVILINSGVQLTPPHELIATATAVTASTRSIAAGIFVAIFTAAFSSRLDVKLPTYVAEAAAKAGLPATSIPTFVGALAANDKVALLKVPGVTGQIIGAGVAALRHAFTDSLRIVYIIAAPFGAAACISCLFLGSVKQTMNYRVDAPIEQLHAKRQDRLSTSSRTPE